MRILALAFAVLLPATVAADEPVSLRLTYDAHIGGVRVLSIAALARFAGGGYDLEVASRTVGVVGWVGDWRGNSFTKGTVGEAGLRPVSHRADSVWRGETRFVELTYAADRGVAVSAEPPPDKDDRDPVPEALTRNTVDTLTAIMGLVRSFGADGKCAGAYPAFDGRRRYDIRIEDAGAAVLEPTSYSVYAGPARKCQVTTKRVAGYWKGRGNDAAEQQGFVWMAPAKPGQLPVPVRAEAETALGTMVLNLRKAE